MKLEHGKSAKMHDKLLKDALSLSMELNKRINKMEDLELKEKITNSSLAMLSNISNYFELTYVGEEIEKNENNDLRKLVLVAKDACIDLRYRLNIVRNTGYLDLIDVKNFIKISTEISNELETLL